MGLKGREMDEGIRSVEGYRKRAAQLRAEATTLNDRQAMIMLLDVARSYDTLAESLEKMGRVTGPQNSN